MKIKTSTKESLACIVLLVCLSSYVQTLTPSITSIDTWSTSQKFEIQGITKGDQLGYSVSGAGDVNGDGFMDVIIGAPFASPLGRSLSGSAYVLFGSETGLFQVDLKNLTSTQGFTITGANNGDQAGTSVSGAGDINGDGIDDIIIGCLSAQPLERTDAGSAYVIFGTRNVFSDIDLATLTTSQGFQIMGASAGDELGTSVSKAGDFNADGIDDIIIGASNASLPGHPKIGIAYVIFGSCKGFSNIDLNTLTSTQGIQILGATGYDRIGSSVSGAGDINADGIDDIIIGAKSADPLGRMLAGTGYVIFGSRNELFNLDLANFTTSQGFQVIGAQDFDGLGGSVSSAGDVNGDGIDDLIIGAGTASPWSSETGAAYVIFGGSKDFSNIDLNNLTITEGFHIIGANAYDGLGISVSGAGDVNGDGIDDILIGASWASLLGSDEAGATYVLFGKRSGLADLDLSDFNSTQGVKLSGAHTLDYFGYSVSGVGDVNGDGLDDIIIGAPGDFERELGQPGDAYIILGVASPTRFSSEALTYEPKYTYLMM